MGIPTLAHFDTHRFGTDDGGPEKTGGVVYMEVRSESREGDRPSNRLLSSLPFTKVQNQLSHCNIPSLRMYGHFGGKFETKPSVNAPHLRFQFHLQSVSAAHHWQLSRAHQ